MSNENTPLQVGSIVTINGQQFKISAVATAEESREQGLNAHADDMERRGLSAMASFTKPKGARAFYGFIRQDGTCGIF